MSPQPLSIRFEPADLACWRRGLMTRGQTLATLLSEVLAGKQPPALTAILDARPGLHPEEAVRMTLDQVDGRRRLLDADDDRFGRCDTCDVDLGAAALGEMPWADRCVAHAVT